MFSRFTVVMILLLAFAGAVFAQDGGMITYGQIVTGQITNEVPVVSYQFSGHSGDAITVSMRAIQEGLDSYVSLLDPNGQEIMFDDDSGGNLSALLGPVVLPSDGVYTVNASRCCGGGGMGGGSAGSFELVINQVQVTTLPLNETLTIELNDATPFQHYFLESATPGQIFTVSSALVSASDSTGASISLRGPNGSYINQGLLSFSQPSITIEPIITSERAIVTMRRELIDGAGALGTISFSINLQSSVAEPLAFDTTINAELNDANPSDFYTFSAAQGDLMRLAGSMMEGTQPFEIQILSPEGFIINSGSPAWSPTPNSFEIDPLVLDFTGDYILFVRRIDPNGMSVTGTQSSYTITLSDSSAPTLVNGVEVQGHITPQDVEQVYRYEGAAGTTVRVTLRSLNDDFRPGMDIFGPSEMSARPQSGGGGMGGGGMVGGGTNFIFGGNAGVAGILTYEFALPVSGVYRLHIRTGNFGVDGPLPGDYSLLIESVGG
jgi:hypothetical protein